MKTLEEYLALSPDELRTACEAAGIRVAGFRYAAFRGRLLSELVAEAEAFAIKHGADPRATQVEAEDAAEDLRLVYIVEPPEDLTDERVRHRYAKQLHEAVVAREKRAREVEKKELAELARLKAKHEGGGR